jgi:hypothetical protein
LFVPNATVSPVPGTVVVVERCETDVDVDVDGVVAAWLLEQPDARIKADSSAMEATAMGRRGIGGRLRAILCRSLGTNQGLS